MPEFEINQAAHETIASAETPYLPDDFADVPRSRGREGLPKAFRMRHGSHYVEQLMGDAPIQSVRQIPIDQVVGPEVKADVSELVASIREVGLLQPLLVTSREPSRFELLAGRHRLSAARQAGLSAVPCLLVNTDHDADELKAHTERKSTIEEKPTPPPVVAPSIDSSATADVLRTAFSEISTSMRFIDSLAPIARINDSGLRATMLVNAISIEAHRATTLAAAASLLTRREPLRLEAIDGAAVLQAIRAEVRVEARMKGVTIDWTQSVALARTVADVEALSTGWSALVHALLSLADDGDRLEIMLDAPRVRPALILQVKMHCDSPAPAGDRFFDATWIDHPAGRSGAVMLAAALQSARLHGGRLSLATIDDGVSLTFVAPQPLD
ncbi:MAG TPA: ParB N-terminal domain-containing protein [Vicinamibacterales bacterium]|nr:ParB N-terminal domain-containing protein [Vicinamibacterales bacterium]